MTAHKKLTGLDLELSELFAERKAAGVVDIKCHVDVTGATDLYYVKEAMASVLRNERNRAGSSYEVASLLSFDELLEKIY